MRKGTTLQTTVRPLHCGTAAAGSDCGRRNRSQARSTSTAGWTRRPSSWNLVPLNVCCQVVSRGRLSDLSAARVTAAKPPARKTVGGGSSGRDVSTGIAPCARAAVASRRLPQSTGSGRRGPYSWRHLTIRLDDAARRRGSSTHLPTSLFRTVGGLPPSWATSWFVVVKVAGDHSRSWLTTASSPVYSTERSCSSFPLAVPSAAADTSRTQLCSHRCQPCPSVCHVLISCDHGVLLQRRGGSSPARQP